MPFNPQTGRWQDEELGGAMPSAPAAGPSSGSVYGVDPHSLGLNPDDFDMEYEPQRPAYTDPDTAHRNLFDRLAPVLGSAFSASDWDSPMARMLARLAGGVGDYVDRGVKARASAIDTENDLNARLTNQENVVRGQQVGENRRAFRDLMVDRMPTPREILERKMREKEQLEGAGEVARVKARTQAYRDEGLEPPGTPADEKAKAAPKPPAPGKWNARSFKLLGDADEMALKSLEDELKTMKSDPMRAGAFRPQRTNAKGKLIPMSAPDQQTLGRANEINRQVHEARRQAIIWHFQNIGIDTDNDPTNLSEKYKEVSRSAQVLGLKDDPEVRAAAKAAGALVDSSRKP